MPFILCTLHNSACSPQYIFVHISSYFFLLSSFLMFWSPWLHMCWIKLFLHNFSLWDSSFCCMLPILWMVQDVMLVSWFCFLPHLWLVMPSFINNISIVELHCVPQWFNYNIEWYLEKNPCFLCLFSVGLHNLAKMLW